MGSMTPDELQAAVRSLRAVGGVYEHVAAWVEHYNTPTTEDRARGLEHDRNPMNNRTLAARLLGEVTDALPHEPEARRIVEQAASALLQADEIRDNLATASRAISLMAHAVGPITIPQHVLVNADMAAPITTEHEPRDGSIRIYINATPGKPNRDQRQEPTE